MIEVRYAGVVVGRSAVIRELDTRGLFLGVTEPLPVGTPVVLRIGDRPDAPEVQGKVEVVSESPELAHAGMRVRFADPGAAALFGDPSQAISDSRPHAVSTTGSGRVASPTPASTSRPESTAPVRTDAAPRENPPAPRPAVSTAPASNPAPAAMPQPVVAPAPLREPSLAPDTGAVPQTMANDEGEESVGASTGLASGSDTGRIPAPDPTAFGGHGGGKKNRKNRRR